MMKGRYLASIFVILTVAPLRILCEEAWFAPYHVDPRDYISLKRGCCLEEVRHVMGRSLRHLFTVWRGGSRWTLASVLINTGWKSAGLQYGVLFKDDFLDKLVDYKNEVQFLKRTTDWHIIDGKRVPLCIEVCPWDVLDYSYVDRAITAPPIGIQNFWEQVNERRRKDGFSLCGNVPLTLLIAPFAIIEYPRTVKYRNAHISAEGVLSGFRFALGSNVRNLDFHGFRPTVKRLGDRQILKITFKKGKGFLRPYESARSLLLIVKDDIIEAICKNEGSFRYVRNRRIYR